MRAVVITKPGGPEVLEVQDVETPEPVGDQVRVRVHASGVNRADLLQRAGGYAAPPGSPEHIPGLEFAGEVDAVGSLSERGSRASGSWAWQVEERRRRISWRTRGCWLR